MPFPVVQLDRMSQVMPISGNQFGAIEPAFDQHSFFKLS